MLWIFLLPRISLPRCLSCRNSPLSPDSPLHLSVWRRRNSWLEKGGIESVFSWVPCRTQEEEQRWPCQRVKNDCNVWRALPRCGLSCPLLSLHPVSNQVIPGAVLRSRIKQQPPRSHQPKLWQSLFLIKMRLKIQNIRLKSQMKLDTEPFFCRQKLKNWLSVVLRMWWSQIGPKGLSFMDYLQSCSFV